jgi:glycosyltransferase involved in cell wall biosynthesis
LKIVIVKFGELTLEEYKGSNHPEIRAIRNIVSQNHKDSFVLITFSECNAIKSFREGNLLIFNLPVYNIKASFFSQIQTFFIVCMFRPSTIVVFGLSNTILLSFASVLTRSKLISVITGELWFGGSSMPKFLYKPLLKTAFHISRTILAISRSVNSEIVHDYAVNPTKVLNYKYAIHPMFNPSVNRDFKKRFNPNGPIILTVARIVPEKGIHYLIEASRSVVKLYPNVKFIIKALYADHVYQEFLHNLIKKYSLQENITFETQRVPYSEIPKYMAAADIFVLPSISEALGMVILEALSCGIPVIATRVGGIPDILKNGVNGLMVEPGDVRGLAEAIVNVLSNEELRKSLSRGSVIALQDYSCIELGSILNNQIFG